MRSAKPIPGREGLLHAPGVSESSGSPGRSNLLVRHQAGSAPRINFARAEVERDGKPAELSALEFKLLQFLIKRRGDTLSRAQMLNEVWGYDAMPSTRTVDVHVAGLRQKLEENPRHPQFILTAHGLGYKFVG